MKTTIIWEIKDIQKYIKKLKDLGVSIHFGPLSGNLYHNYDEQDWHLEYCQFILKLMNLVEFFAKEEYWRKQKEDNLAKQLTTERDKTLREGRCVSYNSVGRTVEQKIRRYV